MINALPSDFLDHAISHRGLHDLSKKRPENSAAAIQAAVDANYAVEIDVQLTADDKAVVFHDYDLNRLTDGNGRIRDRRAQDLGSIPLSGGSGEGIPTLEHILDIIDGKVPLLIEVKDQDGSLGPDVGILEAAVASAIDGYAGPLAVMSYNPHSVAALQTLAPGVPRGIVTETFQRADWEIPADQLIALTNIIDYERVGASFISHNKRDLHHPRVAELKANGAHILTWTIRSVDEEQKARQIAENVTFEGYLPKRRP